MNFRHLLGCDTVVEKSRLSSQESESKSINISFYLFRKNDVKLKQNFYGGRLQAT